MPARTPTGRLAACEFRDACAALAAAWRRHGGHGEWQWRDGPPSPLRASAVARLVAPGWLELEEHLVRAAPAEARGGIAEGSAAGAAAAEDDDDVAMLPSPPVTWHRYTLAVVFHASYAVPWLLLRGAGPGGQPLPWRGVLADLAPRLGAAAELPPPGAPPLAGALGVLTPCEHPLTGEPWFGLHPCSTADWMALLLTPAPSGDDAWLLDELADADAACAGPSVDDATCARDAADAARLGRYMRAWWSVAGAAVGAALRPAAYAPPDAATQSAAALAQPQMM